MRELCAVFWITYSNVPIILNSVMLGQIALILVLSSAVHSAVSESLRLGKLVSMSY